MAAIKKQDSINKKSVKKPTSATSKAAAKNLLQIASVKKEEKLKVKRSKWAQRMSTLEKDKLLDAGSSENPLKHFERLRDTLHQMQAEHQMDTTKQEPTSKMEINRQKVVSARGRAQALAKEREHYQRVLSHPAFQKNPLETIHQHLLHKYQNIVNKNKK